MTRSLIHCALFSIAVTSASAQTIPPPTIIRTSYISVTGADTVWQNVLRTPQSFQSDVRLPAAGAAVKMTALLDRSALIRKLDLDVWRGTSSARLVHSQSASFAVTDDSVIGEVHGAARSEPQRFPSPMGAMIIQGNYLGFLEQLVLRARALGRPEASIPIYYFGTPGDTGVATVRLPPGTDSAIVVTENTPLGLRVDEWGRIVSGKIGSTSISRVRFREVLPPDSAEPVHCGSATSQARQALSLPALAPVFAHYKVTRSDIASARALSDASDAGACRDMLTLLVVPGSEAGSGQSLFKVGPVYVAVVGTDPAHGRSAVVYADNLEVLHLISLGAGSAGH
jgi:hypothetical protein